MKDLEREQDKALEGLSKAIGDDQKPKTKDLLSDLISFKLQDLVKQSGGDIQIASIMFGVYLDSLYSDTWEGLDDFIKSILQKKLFNLVTKNGVEEGSEKFARFITRAGIEGSEKAGYPMRNVSENENYDPN